MTSLLISSLSPSNFLKHQLFLPPSHLHPYPVVCLGGSRPPPPPPSVTTDSKFALHDALDASGVNTTHARAARQKFESNIQYLTSIEKEVSISINRRVHLGRTVLYIGAEDHALMAKSTVPLPVDYLDGLFFDLTLEFCRNNTALKSTPEEFLASLEDFLYVKKGFKRSNLRSQEDPQALYLHAVLKYQTGSAYMLAIIYSEILKVLRSFRFLDFDCEIFFPHDVHGLPRGYHKQKSKESDPRHILTVQTLLVEILRNIKEAFWPFQHDQSESLFLRAAHAANSIDGSKIDEESGFQLASAKAAHLRRLGHGETRLALSACERLILLESDPKDLRDYGALLYHCGLYEQSLQYLKLYRDKNVSSLQEQASNKLSSLEEEALEKLMIRLNLISMEEGWS